MIEHLLFSSLTLPSKDSLYYSRAGRLGPAGSLTVRRANVEGFINSMVSDVLSVCLVALWVPQILAAHLLPRIPESLTIKEAELLSRLLVSEILEP